MVPVMKALIVVLAITGGGCALIGKHVSTCFATSAYTESPDFRKFDCRDSSDAGDRRAKF